MVQQGAWQKLFVLDEAKLRRMHAVIADRFEHQSRKPEFSFTATFKDGKTVRDNIEALLKVDNSTRNPMSSLNVDAVLGGASPLKVRIEFHNKREKNIFLVVEGSSPSMVGDVYADVVEQVERTFESVVPIISALLLFSIIALTGLFTFFSLGTPARFDGPSLARLHEKAEMAFDQGRKIEFIFEFERLQLQRLLGSEKPLINVFEDHNWLIAILFLLAFGITIALLFQYPAGVYMWGDMAETHSRRIELRKRLWSLLLGGILLALIVNIVSSAVLRSR